MTRLFIFLCSAVSAQLSFAQTGIEQFEWLLGTWEGKMGSAAFTETWTKRDEFTITGEGHAVAKGDTIFSEYLRIEKIGQYWTYIPIAGNQPPIMFVLSSHIDGTWIFENKEHDYPRIIGYRKEINGMALMAWTDGTVDGKQVLEEFRMKKTN